MIVVVSFKIGLIEVGDVEMVLTSVAAKTCVKKTDNKNTDKPSFLITHMVRPPGLQFLGNKTAPKKTRKNLPLKIDRIFNAISCLSIYLPRRFSRPAINSPPPNSNTVEGSGTGATVCRLS